MLPFQIDRETAIGHFKDWCKKHWFLPKDFLSSAQQDKITGLYVPFWVTDVDVNAEMDALYAKLMPKAQAVIDDESFPWSYSGRCKEGNCDFTKKMGFHWTSATPQSSDKNYGEKTGEIGVIIVEKEPEYAGSEENIKFFQVDEKSKFFSVRCVQE